MSSAFAQRKLRDSEVTCAIHERSLQDLQDLSLLPGGFGDARWQAWTFLLGVEVPDTAELNSISESNLSESWTQSYVPSTATTSPKDHPDPFRDHGLSDVSNEDENLPPHPDAHQVQLDTNRSFILYPVENHSIGHRKLLQEGLHNIILQLLQKRPKLRYFQGYHDIMTVLFLTLPAEVVLPSAEKMSLHRLRDSMGSGLDPLVGQLRILKRLLRLIDPSYAEILERNAPLPYYALSNLLTLFSHDVPTLPLIRHIFDWILCREPIAAIWLAAAVILRRKQDILALEREGDEAMGMMHAVLSMWPALSENEPSHPDVDSRNADLTVARDPSESLSGGTPTEKDSIEFSEITSDWQDSVQEIMDEVISADVTNVGAEIGDEKLDTSFHEFHTGTEDKDTNDGTRSPTSDSLESWTADMPLTCTPTLVSMDVPASEFLSEVIEQEAMKHQAADGDGEVRSEVTPEAETRPRHESVSRSRSRSQSRSLPGEYKEEHPAPPIPLSAILRQASELLVAYPPSSPALHLAETFGPQSALHPRNPSSSLMPFDLNDDEADACVGGDNVVLPPTEEEQDEEIGSPRKPREGDRRLRPGKGKGRPIILAKSIVARKQVIVAGVVILLGVAVALYGFGPGGKVHVRNFHKFRGDRRVAAWVGGLIGLGQRLGICV